MNELEEVKHMLERLDARIDLLQLQLQTELKQLYRELGRHDGRLDAIEAGGGGGQ